MGGVTSLGADVPLYQYVPLHSTIQTHNTTFTKIPRDIPNNTQEIMINNHNITAIESGSFKTQIDCLKLDLQRNQIVEVQPDAFTALFNLEILLLKYNHIVKLDNKTFHGLSSNKKIDISSNKIQSIKPNAFFLQDFMIFTVFFPLNPPVSLAFANNRLTAIHNHTFYRVFTLFSLILNFNRISHIDTSAFNNNKDLKKIQLIGNRLTYIRKEIFLDLSLVELDLSNNKILTIEPGSFASMSSGNLSLQNNQIASLTWTIFLNDGSKLTQSQTALNKTYFNEYDTNSSSQANWIFYGWDKRQIKLISSPFKSFGVQNCDTNCSKHGKWPKTFTFERFFTIKFQN